LKWVPFDLSCYHIDDEYTFSPVEIPVPEPEAKLIADVDLVFIHSPALLEKKGKINPRTTFVPNGVDYEAHARPVAEPPDLVSIPRPRVGYCGHIKKQLDWPLLLELTLHNPKWSFVFVGAVNAHPEILPALQELSRRKNVFFLGSKTVQELATYPQHFDVCVMPYRIDDYTKYIYPLKLHEYLASGQPVVGTRIASLLRFGNVVSLVEDPQQWCVAIANSLNSTANTAEARRVRQLVARQHDWEILVLRIARTIAQGLGAQYAQRLVQFQHAEESLHLNDARETRILEGNHFSTRT
jgi:glycosyltransferase involved in cell wall biosynthesis